ncbi:MAG: F0F1 ATP synthase subunit B [Planctomycetes bacterium]|nr:F0F1 ATP synthase subunit B [Planctomycetota bacterium]
MSNIYTPILSIVTAAEGGEEGFNLIRLSDASNAIWTIIIFGLALPVMWKMVWKPMADHLEQRDHKAEEAAHAAEKAKEGAQKSEAEVKRKLDEAQKESARIINESRAAGEVQGREIVATAQKQSQQLLERAKADIEAEKTKALSEIRETVVEISIDAASRVVGRAVADDDQRRFVRDFVASQSAR